MLLSFYFPSFFLLSSLFLPFSLSPFSLSLLSLLPSLPLSRPFLKQVLTIHAVSLPSTKVQSRYLQILGITGKLAFLDIGVVCLIITTMNYPIESKESVGIEGYVKSSPSFGTLLVILVLILSRVLTSTLLHVSPPPSSTPPSPPSVSPVPLALALLSAIPVAMNLGAMFLPFVDRTYRLTFDPTPGPNVTQILLGNGTET